MDFAIAQREDKIFDLVFNEDFGVFETNNTIEMPVLVALLTDSRASETQVLNRMNRRGWIGNLFRRFELGNLAWLEYNSPLTVQTTAYLDNIYSAAINKITNTKKTIEITNNNLDTIDVNIELQVSLEEYENINFTI